MIVHSTGIKRVGQWLLWLMLTVCGVYVLRTLLPVHAQGLNPSTVTLSQTVTKSDGTASDAGTIIYAIRSDGAIARLYSAPPKAPAYGGRILRFPTGQRIYIQDQRQLKSSTLMTNYSIRLPNTSCLFTGEADLGIENISGYRARKIQHRNVTTWASIDYGCQMLQERMDFGNGEVSEKHLVLLQPGEPNAEVFAVSASLSEVPPSKILLGLKEAANDQTNRADKDYEGSHRALMHALASGTLK